MSSTALRGEFREPPRADPLPLGRSWDLTRILLAVAAIGGLIAASFWVLRPFLPAIVWATMIVVATWPMLRGLEARFGGRRGIAVAIMTLAMLTTLAVPLTLATIAIVDHAQDVVTWSKSLIAHPLPALPDWVVRVPLVGKKIVVDWDTLARAPSEELAARVTPHLRVIAAWLLLQAGGIGSLMLQFLLTVAIAAMLYARGESVASGVIAFASRLAGAEGIRVALLSAGAIRAVALGIVVTALVQGLVGGVGLAVTGVPHAVVLTCVMVTLGVAQIGPAPVLIGAVIWLYVQGQPYWAIVLIGWGLLTMSLDNVLRPLLIKRGADLPLLLIIAGVIGGLLAFGLVGLFVGPVILAIAYTLLVAWVRAGEPPAAAPARVAADS
jgi:predicted PurR-regulated permease PerM